MPRAMKMSTLPKTKRRRLEALGARRVEQIRTWWALEAPTGQPFCVVRPQRSELANVWP